MPFANLPTKNVFYTLKEASSSPPITTLLLLHGLGSSSCFYSTITPLLPETARCIALDYPGSGLSPLPSPAPEQSVPSLAKDAIELLDTLEVKEKVVVVGHSMGGILASFIAAEYRDRVKGVVLIGPVNPGPGLGPVFEERIKVVQKDGLEKLADSIPKAATSASSTSLQQAFIRSLILGTSPGGYMSLCNVIAKALKPRYSTIQVPLLLLAGKEDKTAALPACEEIQARYGTEGEEKRLVIVEGCGHWHCVESSGKIADEVRMFVEELTA